MKLTYIFSILIFMLLTSKTNSLGNSIVYDVSQLVKNASFSGTQDTKYLSSIFVRSGVQSSASVYLYYETDLYTDILTEVGTVLKLLGDMRSQNFKPKIIFSIRDTDGRQGKQNIPENLARVLDLCLDNISLVLGVCYNAVFLQNTCHFNGKVFVSGHNTTSVINSMQDYVLESSRLKKQRSDLALGYQLHIDYSDCEDYQINQQKANFLVLEIPLSRNDGGFLESYGLFRNRLDTEIMPALKNRSESKTAFLKVSLEPNMYENEPYKAFFYYTGTGNVKTYYFRQENWLNNISYRLHETNLIISHRYDNLIAEYMKQWNEDNANNKNSIILSYLHVAPDQKNYNDVFKFKERVVVIPYIKLFFESQPIEQPLVSDQLLEPHKIAITIKSLLSTLATEGFHTIMISGKTWNKITGPNLKLSYFQSNNISISSLFYYVEDDEHFEEIKTNPNILREVDNVNEITLVMSNRINDQNINHWDQLVKDLNRKSKSIHIACQIQTNVLKNFNSYDKCSNATTCHAINIRKDFGSKCKSKNNLSTTVIWRQILNFADLRKNIYRSEEFVENIMKKLYSLVVAREIILKEYPNETVILQFSTDYEEIGTHNKVYCDVYAERIQNFYEAILTWAQIHFFPVILEPSSVRTKFDNPLVWNQLQVSTTQLHNLMNTYPFLMRRSYSRSKVFGSWADGMYPCLTKATANDKEMKSFTFLNTGVTLKLDLRSSDLNSDEVQVMLLLLLEKFSEVEIWLNTTISFTNTSASC